MTKDNKDSPEAIQFRALFTRLKDWIDDAPDGLIELAASDEGVKKLCSDLYWAASILRKKEKRGRSLYTAPVDPAFLSAWRDFEKRYESAVSDVWLCEFLPELVSGELSDRSKMDQQWEWEDADAKDRAEAIEAAIDFAKESVSGDNGACHDSDFVLRMDDGVATWERLKAQTDFDLRGVLRRRALVPFVLVPRNVSARHGINERPSMLKNLQQAHDAFTFGAPYAALALMRSIMEAVLRDHYRVAGIDLAARINNARGRLAAAANAARLHQLRKRANAVLHLDPDEESVLPRLNEMQLEREVISFLIVLRALIEGAKKP